LLLWFTIGISHLILLPHGVICNYSQPQMTNSTIYPSFVSENK